GNGGCGQTNQEKRFNKPVHEISKMIFVAVTNFSRSRSRLKKVFEWPHQSSCVRMQRAGSLTTIGN
ncbi:MAG TPA: hypothetical protein VFR76_13255, partial [Verrucomicrobiae bacterium]|nr:hypothetical protein [Verrucomicrobiae bacterium]